MTDSCLGGGSDEAIDAMLHSGSMTDAARNEVGGSKFRRGFKFGSGVETWRTLSGIELGASM